MFILEFIFLMLIMKYVLPDIISPEESKKE